MTPLTMTHSITMKALLATAVLFFASDISLKRVLALDIKHQQIAGGIVSPVIYSDLEKAVSAHDISYPEASQLFGHRAMREQRRLYELPLLKGGQDPRRLQETTEGATEGTEDTGTSTEEDEGILRFTDSALLPRNDSGSGFAKAFYAADNLHNRHLGLPPIDPLDMAVCSSQHYIVQVIRTMAAIFKRGKLVGVINLPEVVGAKTGEVVPDPRCFYDHAHGKFVLVLAHFKRTGEREGRFSNVLYLVSRTPKPTGDWNLFRLPTSGVEADGSIIKSYGASMGYDCSDVCFGDFPTLGHDKYGLYTSVDLFNPEYSDGFVTAMLYAIPKSMAYAANVSSISNSTVMRFMGFHQENPDTGKDKDVATIQPAILQQGSPSNTSFGGVQYFMAIHPDEELPRVLCYSMTNTSQLGSRDAAITINATEVDIHLEYRASTIAVEVLKNAQGEDMDIKPFQLEQVVSAGGQLFTSITALGLDSNEETVLAAMGLVMQPNMLAPGNVTYTVLSNPVVIVTGHHIVYPVVAADPRGRGVMAFSIWDAEGKSGIAYTDLSMYNHSGKVYMVQEPVAQSDAPRRRWGDYYAADYDVTTGQVLAAIQYAKQELTTHPNSQRENIGTVIFRVDVEKLYAGIHTEGDSDISRRFLRA